MTIKIGTKSLYSNLMVGLVHVFFREDRAIYVTQIPVYESSLLFCKFNIIWIQIRVGNGYLSRSKSENEVIVIQRSGFKLKTNNPSVGSETEWAFYTLQWFEFQALLFLKYAKLIETFTNCKFNKWIYRWFSKKYFFVSTWLKKRTWLKRKYWWKLWSKSRSSKLDESSWNAQVRSDKILTSRSVSEVVKLRTLIQTLNFFQVNSDIKLLNLKDDIKK